MSELRGKKTRWRKCVPKLIHRWPAPMRGRHIYDKNENVTKN